MRAQTDLEIKTETSDLEAKHKAELDRWMLTAFEGDAEAQFKVGMLHTNTQFNKPDYEQAVYWYRQASRQGHVLAQYNLGHQYLMGLGVQKSESTAMKWWTQAAKQEHPLAQFNIGRAYYLGIGLEQDHKKSKYWFKRAADNEEPKSIEILAKLGWTEGEIEESVATDFDLKPNSDAEVNKQPQIDGQTEAATVAQASEDPKPAAELAIKETPDRLATLDLKSKIIPIDLAEETADQATPNSSEPLSENSGQTDTSGDAQESAPIASETASSPELKSSLEPKDSLEPDSSKPIIAENKTTAGNLKPDEQLAQQTPLNKTVVGKLKKDQPKIKQTTKPVPVDNKIPVAIYTNPKIRSVLIAIIDDRDELKIVKAESEWSSVKSTKGIPVWVHGDYLKLAQALAGNDNVMASVTGDNVNTRSVPIVSSGTVVGRLNKEERLKVIEKRADWYRVIAPPRFIAWVKTQDFNTPPPKAQATLEQVPGEFDSNHSDDEWLFQQKASDFTIQLGSFVGLAQAQNYLQQINFNQSSDLHQLVSKTGDKHRTVFLYGAHKDRDLANKRKSVVDQNQAWVRSLGGLQENRCNHWRAQKPASEELRSYCK